MNSGLSKGLNLKIINFSKIAFTIISSSFFLYALGQAPIFKNILAGAFSCSGWFKLVFVDSWSKLEEPPLFFYEILKERLKYYPK